MTLGMAHRGLEYENVFINHNPVMTLIYCKIVIPPIKKPRRKVYRYQKGDYESMRADTLKFAKEKYFNGYSDTRSVQENFNLITSFIQDSADKHMPSKQIALSLLSNG